MTSHIKETLQAVLHHKSHTNDSPQDMSHLPKTYKAAFFEKKGEPLVIRDVELKQPSHGQVLVKTLACGVCHSDSAVQGGIMGSFPRVPGHEIVGDVVALGDGESRFKIGDRVGGAWHGGHDGICKSCNRGLFQMCEHEEINGVTLDGGYAEYVLLRSEAVVRVPKELDPATVAPLLCAGVTVFNSLRKLNVNAGDIVAVQGLGGLSHLALQYSSKMGFRTVAISSSESKRDFATKLGAHDYIDASKVNTIDKINELGGAACIIATAPDPKIIEPLINALAPQGKLLVLSPCGNISINTIPLILKGLSVSGFPSGHALDSEEAIAFAEVHGVKCMVEKFPLAEANKAYEHMMANKARFRAVLTF